MAHVGHYDGRAVVSVTGTPVPLKPAEFGCYDVEITAEFSNTGLILLGDSAVVAAVVSRTGISIKPGETHYFKSPDVSPHDLDLNEIYIDAEVPGDGVFFGGIIVP